MKSKASRSMETWTMIIVLILIALLTSGCATDPANGNQVDPATQAARSVLLATRMAENLQATNQVRFAYVTATAEAFQSLLAGIQSWPVVFSDSFDEDEGNWITGESEDPLATMNWAVENGTYNWSASANSGFLWWMVPDTEELGSFYLAADTSLVDGPEDAEMGLVFRSDGESNYYTFMIDNQGHYSVSMHSPAGWETLLDWTLSSDILVGQANNLSVIAEGDRFLLFVNKKYQRFVQDDRLQSGEVGLAIGLSNAGEQANWEFDNFELRAPKRDQIEALIP